MNGGIGRIEMLKRTNILALVGGGSNPRFPPNKIIIWDDHQGRIISMLRFNKNVLNVRLVSDKIVGIVDDKIFLFNINTLETIAVLDTYDNPTGMIGISQEMSDKLIIAYPKQNQGIVNIRNCINKKTIKDSKLINAHESKLAYISVNRDGTLLATTSDKGTLIRLFTIPHAINIATFRRGTKNVTMNCICFSANNVFVGCSSDGGTIHIFSLTDVNKRLNENNNKSFSRQNSQDEPKNQKSFLSKIGGFFKINNEYMEHDRNFAKFKMQEEYSLLAFGSDNTITTITMDGKYYKAAYDPKNGGDCQKIEEKNFLVDTI